MTKLPFIPAMEIAAGAAAVLLQRRHGNHPQILSPPLSSSHLFKTPPNSNNLRFPIYPFLRMRKNQEPTFKSRAQEQNRAFHGNLISKRRSLSSSSPASAGWLLGLGDKNPILPEIVKAGDPALHEPACEVDIEEIGSEKIKKIIQNTISVMRKAPGVGLAAPQIGIPLKVLISSSKRHHVTSNGYLISLQQTR